MRSKERSKNTLSKRLKKHTADKQHTILQNIAKYLEAFIYVPNKPDSKNVSFHKCTLS